MTAAQTANADAAADFIVKDLSLAGWGRTEIEMAETEMPGLIACREEFGRSRPLTGARRDRYAWYGAMTLVPHLVKVLAMPGAEVHLTLHPPLRATDFANRKALARESEARVAAGIAAAFGAVPVPAEAAAE